MSPASIRVAKTPSSDHETIGTVSGNSGPGFISMVDHFRTQSPRPSSGANWGHPRTPLHVWRTQPAVRNVVDFLAKQFASVPMVLLQQVGDNDTRKIRDGDAYDLLRRPSGLMSPFMLWSQVMVDRLLYDTALVLHRDGELMRVSPSHYRIRSDMLGMIREIRVQAPGGETFDATDLPHLLLHGWHAHSAGGVSPLHTLAATLDEAQRSVEWRSQQWENGPKMSGLLKRPVEARRWDPAQKAAFLETWRSWSTAEKAGGTPILENGMEYEQLNDLTSADARDVEGRQLTNLEVATFFGVAPELLGIREGKFAGLDAHRKSLYGSLLGPWCMEIEQAFNSQLLPSLDTRDGVSMKMDLDSMASGTRLEKAKIFQILTGAPVMTRAEARDDLNLPRLDGTEELVVPMNLDDGSGS